MLDAETGSVLDKPVWIVEDLAEFPSIKPNTIYKQIYSAKNGLGQYTLPPYFRVGSRIRFHRDDVLRWMNQKRQGGTGG